MKTQHVSISDCTLRDACNAPGIFLGQQEMVDIARQLDQLGIQEIEHGIALTGDTNDEIARTINQMGLKAQTSCVFFCLRSSAIDEAVGKTVDNGYKAIMISIPSSEAFRDIKLKRSFRATCSLLAKAVGKASASGLQVIFSGEDAARGELGSLVDYIRTGAQAGASRFRFAESVACLSPEAMKERIRYLTIQSGFPVEVHCHSAHGLAVTNTIAAIEAGASWASVTVNGIGERGGNTPLETILIYLTRYRRQTDFNLRSLKSLSDYVSQATNLPVHRFTPIVGDDCFQYEIGNQYKKHPVYEDLPPEIIGNSRKLLYGKKFDRVTLGLMLNMLNLHDGEPDLDRIECLAREYVEKHRQGIEPEMLNRLIKEKAHANCQ